MRVWMRVVYANAKDDGMDQIGGAFTEEMSAEEVQCVV
jgi:hypothetical protein